MNKDAWSGLVFDGDLIKAKLRQNGGRTLIVTFDYRRLHRDGFDTQPPTARFRQAGVDQLHVFAARNDWFINTETPALEAALADAATGYDRVRVFGYSMGGYGAFRFAKSLGAREVVAVSPQATIAPDAVPDDRRYRREARRFDAEAGALVGRGTDRMRGFIAVDPFRPIDMAHARLIQAEFPSVEIARLPFGGHPATKALAGARRRLAPHDAILADAVSAANLVALHRAVRAESIDYWKEMAKWADRKRPQLADAARLAVTTLRIKRQEARLTAKSG